MIGGLLKMLYGFNARVGAVANGLECSMFCAAEAASSTASGGYGARAVKWACLACSWDGGEHAGRRRGIEVVWSRGNGACSAAHVGMVVSGTGAAFLAVLVIVFEAGLVERRR